MSTWSQLRQAYIGNGANVRAARAVFVTALQRRVRQVDHLTGAGRRPQPVWRRNVPVLSIGSRTEAYVDSSTVNTAATSA